MLLLAGLLTGGTGVALVIMLLLVLVTLSWALPRFIGQSRLKQGCLAFHQQREQLEKEFFDLAGKTGIPRGLVWVR